MGTAEGSTRGSRGGNRGELLPQVKRQACVRAYWLHRGRIGVGGMEKCRNDKAAE
jgi:hypothetical protein